MKRYLKKHLLFWAMLFSPTKKALRSVVLFCVFIHDIFGSKRKLRVSSLYDSGELVGLKGCAADKAAVNVGLCKKLSCVAVVH